MLFWSTVMVTVVAVVLELVLIYHLPRVAMWFEKNVLAGAIFSIGLSVILGSLFGAGGLIVMAAGMTSTLVTAALYKVGFLRILWRYADWQSRRNGEAEKFKYVLNGQNPRRPARR